VAIYIAISKYLANYNNGFSVSWSTYSWGVDWKCRTWNCRTWNWRTKWQDIKMQDMNLQYRTNIVWKYI